MKSIAFYVNATKPSAPEVRNRLVAYARKSGMEVVDAGASVPDVVAVLGGDGTMLSAVHQYKTLGCISGLFSQYSRMKSYAENSFLKISAISGIHFLPFKWL